MTDDLPVFNSTDSTDLANLDAETRRLLPEPQTDTDDRPGVV